MLKCECNEKHARLECEPLPNGLTLVRVYEDEQEVTREAVSNMDALARVQLHDIRDGHAGARWAG